MFIAVLQSFLLVSVFGGVGSEKYSLSAAHDAQVTLNHLGCMFLITSDQFAISAFAMILMIPSAFPVYQREVNNRMFRPSCYFWANTFSSLCTYMVYPILVSLFIFWFLEFQDSSFGAFLAWMGVLFFMAFAGICAG